MLMHETLHFLCWVIYDYDKYSTHNSSAQSAAWATTRFFPQDMFLAEPDV